MIPTPNTFFGSYRAAFLEQKWDKRIIMILEKLKGKRRERDTWSPYHFLENVMSIKEGSHLNAHNFGGKKEKNKKLAKCLRNTWQFRVEFLKLNMISKFLNFFMFFC